MAHIPKRYIFERYTSYGKAMFAFGFHPQSAW